MARGSVYPGESSTFEDQRTGAVIRQVTRHASIHHQPFFIIPAYDDAMQRLIFVSHRTGRPEIFAEDRASGNLIQLTEMDAISEYSVYPSHDGRYVYFTAGSGAYRVHTTTYETDELVNFGDVTLRGSGMIADAAGTTALSHDDHWWAIRFTQDGQACLAIIDTVSGTWEVILRRDNVAHMIFCPDDPTLLYYAGPLTDRVWCINRDGSNNRRLYQRQPGEWITHEVWIPGTRELAFVDWPHGIRCVHVDTGVIRRVTSFNAWHAVCNRTGTLMVADTNFPDIGMQLFNPRDAVGAPTVLCYPDASSMGEHWNGPFPYDKGPIKVYAPQHTHPHPSFSPDGTRIVFTSDKTGFAHVYEVEVPTTI
jgi:oligogalacturonide lyase